MKLIILYVADQKDFVRYSEMLRDMGISVPIHIISQEDKSSFVLNLPLLVTKYNTYEGESEIKTALRVYKDN